MPVAAAGKGLDSPIRVLHLIKALGRGGAEVLLAQGFGVSDREQFDLHYAYLLRKPDDVAEDLIAMGAPVHCFGARGACGLLSKRRDVARHLLTHEIDIVHAHLPLAGFMARKAGRLAGVPVVYTEHTLIERYHPVARWLNRLSWSLQARAIAISDDVADSIRRNNGTRVTVETVPNGVNTEFFDRAEFEAGVVKVELGIPTTARVLGTVAVFRDTPAKRLDVWIAAAANVMAQRTNVHAVLVGDGPLRNSLERQARDTGLGNRFHFVGKRSDVRPYLREMDVFLMSSAYEGFGVAPAEAMSMEVPVVSTDVTGVREVVVDGVTGELVPFDNHAGSNLADAVIRLLDDERSRWTMGAQARQHVQENLSMRRMQTRLEQIYRDVLAQSGPGAVDELRTS